MKSIRGFSKQNIFEPRKFKALGTTGWSEIPGSRMRRWVRIWNNLRKEIEFLEHQLFQIKINFSFPIDVEVEFKDCMKFMGKKNPPGSLKEANEKVEKMEAEFKNKVNFLLPKRQTLGHIAFEIGLLNILDYWTYWIFET